MVVVVDANNHDATRGVMIALPAGIVGIIAFSDTTVKVGAYDCGTS
jgi:hypothetical protein